MMTRIMSVTKMSILTTHYNVVVFQLMITAEEMAIADTDIELKIIHLIQLIKWHYQRGGVSMQASNTPGPSVNTVKNNNTRGGVFVMGWVG